MRRFGLIGKTLKHSFSQSYFTRKFSESKLLDCRYDNFELSSINELPGLLENTPNLRGFNVTIPYKLEVIPFLHHKMKMVEEIGACNCVRINGSTLTGYNTDAIAFQSSLKKRLRPHHHCALVLGSGGASKAVQYALKELGIDFFVVSRNKKFNQLGYEDIGEEMIRNHQIIINTTPLGMYPNIQDDPPIPYRALTTDHLLYDLVYNPEKTKFLQQGEQKGAEIINGLEMLHAQAEESWKIWNT
ncbi:MAG: shikimate dehydrogenase family protein [Flavisolibacter sp.]